MDFNVSQENQNLSNVTPEEIQRLSQRIAENAPPFYREPEFWIATLIGIGSIVFSILAFIEAKRAKVAAGKAGTTVKIQTITIELTEIAQRLDKLDYELEFTSARDLLNEVNRRLRRLVAPFQNHDQFKQPCCELKTALDAAKDALEKVRPTSDDAEATENMVYFGMQGHFATISAGVAEIMGLFEAETIEPLHEPRTTTTS